MDIIMLKTAKGSTDGYTVKHYLANERYGDVQPELATVFIENGLAKLAKDPKVKK